MLTMLTHATLVGILIDNFNSTSFAAHVRRKKSIVSSFDTFPCSIQAVGECHQAPATAQLQPIAQVFEKSSFLCNVSYVALASRTPKMLWVRKSSRASRFMAF